MPKTVAPGLLCRLGDADAGSGDDLNLSGSRKQRKRRLVQRQSIARCGNSQCLTDPSRPGAKQSHIGQAAAPAHEWQTGCWLERPDQDGAGRAGRLADEVQAPVNAIGAIDVGVARRAEHDRIACRRPAKAVRGRIGVMIRLDFDQPPADPIEEERRPDQVARDLVNAAAEEGFGQASGHAASLQVGNSVVNRHLTEMRLTR